MRRRKKSKLQLAVFCWCSMAMAAFGAWSPPIIEAPQRPKIELKETEMPV